MTWVPVPLSSKLFLNLDETALTQTLSLLENAWVTEAGSIARFWGLEEVVDLAENGRVYLSDWEGDLVASTSTGNFYRIDRNHNVENKTGVPVTGGRRTVFSRTEDRLMMAAGEKPVSFDGATTSILSEDAPDASHIAFLQGYGIANEIGSGRWQHSEAGDVTDWPALNINTASSRPDPITSVLVTPFDELMLAGPKSVEQWERLQQGDSPFYRRWTVGQGILGSDLVTFLDNGMWAVNSEYEVVRITGQVSNPASGDIGRVLSKIDDWTDAWLGGFPDQGLTLYGQTFLMLQIPFCSNPYGTKGRTFVLDVRSSKWFEISGWDGEAPTRWPGWSYWPCFGRMYVGGEGKIYRFTDTSYANAGGVARMILRTAHLGKQGPLRIDNSRMSIKRGLGSNTSDLEISLRYRKDNYNWSRWVRRGLGRAGQTRMTLKFGGFGTMRSLQIEVEIKGDADIQIGSLEIDATPLDR